MLCKGETASFQKLAEILQIKQCRNFEVSFSLSFSLTGGLTTAWRLSLTFCQIFIDRDPTTSSVYPGLLSSHGYKDSSNFGCCWNSATGERKVAGSPDFVLEGNNR